MQAKWSAIMIALGIAGAGIPAWALAHDSAQSPVTEQQDLTAARTDMMQARNSAENAAHDISPAAARAQGDAALLDAYDAEDSAQLAQALMPEHAGEASTAGIQRELNRVQEAAQADRETIQALAEMPVSRQRDASLHDARKALADSEEAEIRLASHLPS